MPAPALRIPVDATIAILSALLLCFMAEPALAEPTVIGLLVLSAGESVGVLGPGVAVPGVLASAIGYGVILGASTKLSSALSSFWKGLKP